MPRPRKSLVSLDTTPYYHCISRCVRRAFLCGKDPVSGNSYEHRRGWIEQRLLELAEIFAIDIASYAVMHNHYHTVLYINESEALSWSELEVVERWHRLFKGSDLSQRFSRGEVLSKSEKITLKDLVSEWRERLRSISWFMRCINEPIARKANKEDDVTGRFWEGRFNSQALLDDKALASCMVYVDLNPIRAGMAMSPEASDYTSIKRRISDALNTKSPELATDQAALLPFSDHQGLSALHNLPFQLKDYLELVEWTGRIMLENRRGAIPDDLPPLLERLNIDSKHWLYLSKHFESPFGTLVGAAFRVRKACENLGKKWAHGIRHCETLLASS